MKKEPGHQWKKPVQLLQVFSLKNVYGKDEKSFDDRRDLFNWPEFDTRNGFTENGNLYLPATIARHPRLDHCELVTVRDHYNLHNNKPEPTLLHKQYSHDNIHLFNLHHPNSYECFRIGGNPINLTLNYNRYVMGDPQRMSYTLCTLRENEPVLIKINGKLDVSSGRFFQEFYFLFNLCGSYSECIFFEATYMHKKKRVPSTVKEINLLKPLW